MSFSPVQCGPNGAVGQNLALGLIASQLRGTLPPQSTEIGKVESVDANGNPPTLTLTDGRTLRYIDDGSTYAVADKVLVQLNGAAPFVTGHLTATPTDPVTPTEDWFETQAGETTSGDGTGDRPPIGFRFWQGTADSFGNGEVSIALLPDNILVAIATSPETLNGDRQWHRPVLVNPDGIAKISGMRPGRPWKLFIIAKNEEEGGTAEIYNYIATGENVDQSDELGGAHPRFAVAYKTGTLSATGTRGNGNLPSGVSSQYTMMVHARAIIDGNSVDLSRFAEDNYPYGSGVQTGGTSEVSPTPAVDPDGSIDASHSSTRRFRNATYYMTWVHTPTTGIFTTAFDVYDDHIPTSGFWGAHAIGEQPEFEVRLLEWGNIAGNQNPPVWGADGRLRKQTYIPNAREKIVCAGATESLGGRELLGAEFNSVSRDEWEFALPSRVGEFNSSAQWPWGMAVVLRGANTCQPAGKTGFTNPPPAPGDPAAATFRAAAEDNNKGSSWTATMPTHVADDLLLLTVAMTSTSPYDQDCATPSGWTEILTMNSHTHAAPCLFAFTKIASSASETAPSISLSGTGASWDASSTITSWQNATSATGTTGDTNTTESTIDFPTGTTSHDIYVHVQSASLDGVMTTPSGDTLIENNDNGTSGDGRTQRVSTNASSAALTGTSHPSGNYGTSATISID